MFVVGGEDAAAPNFPVVKNDKQARELLLSLVSPLQSDAVGLYRLAFVTQLTKDAETLAQANKEAAELVSLTGTPADATDFTFILNIRKSLKQSGSINRICRWQALEKQLVQVQMNPQGGTLPLSMQPGFLPTISQPSVNLNIDINTADHQSIGNSREAQAIIEEMIAESELIRNGGYNAFVA